MRLRFKLFWALVGGIGGLSCTTTDGLVRSAAAEEFGCDERAIRVTYLGDDHYEAVGCGRRERYAFHDRETCPSGRCPYR